MIPFADASPRARVQIALALLLGGLLVTAALGVVVALAGLGQLGLHTRWASVPRFFWYYRQDPTVRGWFDHGMMLAALAVSLVILGIVQRTASLHGSARFAREGELRREGLRAKDGIILGRKSGRYLTFGGSEHVLLEAPTRGGKGVGIVIPNLLNWRDSVVVLDVKKENWEVTAGFREKAGQEVFLYDPLDVEGRTARYNPLGYIDRDAEIEVINELQKIAVMLFPAPDRGDPFWTEAARVGFVGVGAYVASEPDLPFTIGEIYRHLTNGNPKHRLPKLVAKRAQEGRPLSPAAVSALADFTTASENTFASIKQTITGRLNLWINPYVDAATSASDIDLRDIRRRRISIYLGVSPDNIDRIAPLYNLFFQQLVDLNTRDLPGMGGGQIKVLVLLDEFARLGRATVIASGFSYVAGYGLRLLPVIQSRAQLRAIYGNDVTDEIVTNCGVEVAFTPKDLRVSNELSERLGFYTVKAVSRSRSIHGMLANRSQSESDHRRALMLPQELMQMPKGRLLVLRAGIPPIRGAKILYYKRPDFRARVLHPPALPERAAPALPSHGEPYILVPDAHDDAAPDMLLSEAILAEEETLTVNPMDLDLDMVELVHGAGLDPDEAARHVQECIAKQLDLLELA